jgi:hypothetical protein
MTDIAETNLNLAIGLPGSETLDVEQCLARLDTWSRLVASKTDRWLPMFHRSPAKFDGSLPKFRMLALDELQRIVSNYRDRRMPVSVRDRAVSCHA